jgi:hypothetical protein
MKLKLKLYAEDLKSTFYCYFPGFEALSHVLSSRFQSHFLPSYSEQPHVVAPSARVRIVMGSVCFDLQPLTQSLTRSAGDSLVNLKLNLKPTHPVHRPSSWPPSAPRPP